MENKTKSFLQRLAQIESSGGKNLNHKTIEDGIHEGDAAIGRYGLMPNTIKEIINREKMAGNDDPLLDTLSGLEGEGLKRFILENPEVEETLAKNLASKVLNNTNNESQAAYAWNMGHNLSPEEIEARNIDDHPYVQKYDNLRYEIPTPVGEGMQMRAEKALRDSNPEDKTPVADDRNILQKLLDEYEKGSNEVNEMGIDYMTKLRGGNREEAEALLPLKMDPLGFIGSIKNVAGAANKASKAIKGGQFTDDIGEVTGIAKGTVDKVDDISPLQKSILDKQQRVRDINSPDVKLSNKKYFEKHGNSRGQMPAAAEESLVSHNRDIREIMEREAINETKNMIPKAVKPKPLEKLPYETFGDGMPVAEEESLLRNLLKKKN